MEGKIGLRVESTSSLLLAVAVWSDPILLPKKLRAMWTCVGSKLGSVWPRILCGTWCLLQMIVYMAILLM
jgi:hypothetical protein